MFFNLKSTKKSFAALSIFAALSFATALVSCDNTADDSQRMLIIMAKKKKAAIQEEERRAREEAEARAAAEQAAQAAAEERARQAQIDSARQSRVVIFRGTANVQGVSGAAPQAVAALAAESEEMTDVDDALNGLVSRSALPNANDAAAYEYFAQATAPGKETVEGRFGTGTAARQFELALEIGNTWTITCGVRGKVDKKIALSDSYVFEASVDEPVLSRSFTPVPASAASGSLSLSFEIPAGVSSVKATCSDPGWKAACGGSDAKQLAVSGSSAILEFSEIKSGAHTVMFAFCDAAGIPLYTTVQTVSVFDNMKTDWWASGGGSDDLAVSGGQFILTSAIIEKFTSTTIYVGDTHFGDAPSDETGDGSPAMPLASLNRAAATIAATGSADKEYRIFIAGSVEGTSALTSALNGKAKSVAIIGVNGLDENRVPKDALDGKQGGTTLSVSASVPITIQNLKITGGSDAGIRTDSDAANVSLTLADGALVAGNKAGGTWQVGGGIYHGGGKLFMRGYACVGDPNAACAESAEAASNSGRFAGGIYVRDGAALYMGYRAEDKLEACTGGVFNNYSTNTVPASDDDGNDDAGGGGIAANGTVKIASGTIRNNGAARSGGGIATSTGTVEIRGGTISGNKAAVRGGGVYVGAFRSNSPSLAITGGVISQNQAPDGGAVYFDPAGAASTLSLSGNAKIDYSIDPARGAPQPGQNDVWLAAGKSVQIAGALSQSQVAALTLSSWRRGAKIITPKSGSLAGGVAEKFALTALGEDGWEKISASDKITINAPIYIGKKPDGSAGSDSFSGTRSAPFATLSRACQDMDDAATDYIVRVNGEATGAQKIPASLSNTAGDSNPYHAKSLSLEGQTGNTTDSINAGGNASALIIESAVPITIKNLKITGAGLSPSGTTDLLGGGICQKAGILHLADGAWIAGNYATQGGGVYVDENCSLFMSGSALIGSKENLTVAADAATPGRNLAREGGGIYVDGKASLYLGYDGFEADGTTPHQSELTGGVVGNVSQKISGSGNEDGGGICTRSSGVAEADAPKVKIASGKVAHNSAKEGGGLYLGIKSRCDFTGGSVEGNEASEQGGGICSFASSGSDNVGFYASGSAKISANKVTGSLGYGGAVAVRNNKGLHLSGGVEIPYGGSPKQNDVWLWKNDSGGYVVAIDGDLTKENVAVLTPSLWSRGGQVLYREGGLSASDLKKFKISDGDFKIFTKDTQPNDGLLNAPVYVASSVPFDSSSSPRNKVCQSAVEASIATGSKTLPCATIQDALKLLEAGAEGVIIVDGHIDSSDPHRIGTDANSATGATSVTIKGYAPEGSTTSEAVLDYGGSSAPAESILTIGSGAVPVTIERLTISNARRGTADNGGGINMAAGSDVTLGAGAVITECNANEKGGGVYMAGAASLKIAGGKITKNKTKSFGANIYAANSSGGDPNIEMSDGEISDGIISDATGDTVATSGDALGAAVYLQGPHAKMTMTGGSITWNKAYAADTANACAGVCLDGEGATFTMTGGELSHNLVKNGKRAGGAVRVGGGTFVMGGDAKIYPHIEGKYEAGNNDIHLVNAEGATDTIKLKSDLNKPNANNKVPVDLPSWKRGTKFLQAISVASGGELDDGKLTDNIIQKFEFTDKGWDKSLCQVSSYNDAAKIDSPIYVASKTASQRVVCADLADNTYPKDTGNTNGNKAHPFESIKAACSVMDDATQLYKIQIDGTILGEQEIPDTLSQTAGDSCPYHAKGIYLQSAGDSTATGGVINANLNDYAGVGSALSINSPVYTAIERLTITGGYANANGGGICANAGARVDIGDKTVIKGNKARYYGGGIYIDNGASVYIHDKVVIGIENANSVNEGFDATYRSTGANIATTGAGIYNFGKLYCGRKLEYTSGTLPNKVTLYVCGNTAAGGDNSSANCGGGIFVAQTTSGGELEFKNPSNAGYNGTYNIKFNYAAKDGGGIYFYNNNTTTIGADISLNIEGNKAESGGGIYYKRSTDLDLPKNCSITSNEATEKGGGIYNTSGNPSYGINFTKSGVKVAKNKAKIGGGIYCSASSKTTLQYGTVGGSADDANTATVAGGAVYVEYSNSNNFAVKGDAKIPPAYDENGSCVNNNDVYLALNDESKTARIYIDGTSLSETTVAAITPQGWKRGSEVLKSSGAMTLDLAGRFKMSQDAEEWNNPKPAEVAAGSTPTTAYITMPVYVAGSGRQHCDAPPATESARVGTKSAPFAKINDAAVKEAVAGKADIVVDGTVDGKVDGVDSYHYIGTEATANLRIRGYIPAGQATSAAKLTRTLASDDPNGCVLYVGATGKTITINNLEISGGKKTGYGGGIMVAGGAVNLGVGVVIKGNYASDSGGGVYVASGAKLGVYGDAVIGNSGATADSVSGYWAKLASDSESVRAQGVSDALSAGANVAANGGGVYNDGGQVYFGCVISANANGTSQPANELSGGLYANVATALGGGIYAAGTNYVGGSSGLICPGGNIKFNYAATSGGGIYCYCDESSSAMIARKCDISNNKSASGGGAYVAAGKKLSLTQNAKVYSNEATASGGGIYAAGTLTMANTVTIGQDTSGEAKPNTAATHGGAVYVESGAKFQMSGSACVPPVKDTSKTDGDYYKPNQNDVFLAKNADGTARAAITVGDTVLSAAAPVAALTLEEYKRGITIAKHWNGETLATGTNAKFATTEYDDEWKKTQSTDNKSVTLESDVYVASYDITSATDATRKYCSAAPSSGNNGTKRKPYGNISDALAVFNDASKDAEIIIDGTVTIAQTVGSATAKDIIIKGYTYTQAGATKSDATLQGGFASGSGTRLKIQSNNRVRVQYLTIRGGYAPKGGGIYVDASDTATPAFHSVVSLEDGVVVKGNRATANGGGVYVEQGAALGLYKNVTIGKTGLSDAPAKSETPSSSNDINRAANGGGIYNKGQLVIGKLISKNASGKIEASETGSNINICGNVADQGGGLYADGVKFGDTSATKNEKATWLTSGGFVKCNRADNGGGLYITGGKEFYMDGGQFELDKAEKFGGAVYQYGTFNICDKAQIAAATAEKVNDIYLPGDTKLVTVCGDITTTGTTVFAGGTITPGKPSESSTDDPWVRGRQILAKGGSLSGLTSAMASKFSVSDSEWSVVLDGESGTAAKGCLDAEIWVAGGTLSSGVGNTVTGGNAPSDSGNKGTKTQPYATIATAAGKCWGNHIIYIDGTVTAPDEDGSKIPDTVTTDKVSAITLLGNGTNGATLMPNNYNRVLYINSQVPVTIKKLKITGADCAGKSGAGIQVANGGSLTLSTGTEVHGNVGSDGGGVSVWGTGSGADLKMATLIMEDTAKIYGNTAGGKGGGVYLNKANMYMSGTALVGSATTSATGATGVIDGDGKHYSNKAPSGGGIYAEASNVYLGYAGDGSISALNDNCGVCYNYATGSDGGGGIYIDSGSVLYMGSGKISKNGAATNGGGIFNAGKVFLHTKALVGDSSSSAATEDANSNTAGTNGGGIYSSKGSYVGLGYSNLSGSTWTAKTLNDGYGVVGNFASEGGGVYGEGASGYPGELRMGSGNISANCANHEASNYVDYGGGGVYTKSTYFTVYMSGGEISNNKAAACGGGAFISGKFYMSGNAAIGNMASNSGSYAQNTVGSFSNWAVRGGGIYIINNAILYMGYKGDNEFDNDFSGGIAYNWANLSGGGAHNKGAIYMAGGTIKSNSASYSGGGVCQSNWFYMGGGATIPAGSVLSKNGIFLNTASAKVGGFTSPTRPLTGSGVVAKIEPNSYSTSSQVLDNYIKASANRFAVFNDSHARAWSINSSTGCLVEN